MTVEPWSHCFSAEDINSPDFGVVAGVRGDEWPQLHIQSKSDFSNGRQRTWNRSFVGPAGAEIAEEDWGEWRLVSDLTDEEVAARGKEEREKRERDPPKNRWSVYSCLDGKGNLTGYVVRDQFGDLDREKPFAPDEYSEAHAEANEWNRFDRQGPLPPEFEDRRRNLAKIRGRELFGGDLPPAPERYAIRGYADNWGSFVDLHETLEQALDAAAGEGAGVELFDLDTGEELPLKVTATVAA